MLLRLTPPDTTTTPALDHEAEGRAGTAGALWEEHDLVFVQPNGRPIDPRGGWDGWKALLAAAGVRDAHVHDRRHTAGTLLIEQGVHVRTVQRYTHVASPMAEDGMKRMGAALWDEAQ